MFTRDQSEFYMGVDLGQRQDHTAIAVVARVETAEFGMDWIRQSYAQNGRIVTYDVRHLERMQLGTPYFDVVERVRTLIAHPNLAGRCSVAVDATGVGGPVVERLIEAGLGSELVPVTITGGDEAVRRGRMWSVPKADLMIGLLAMLEVRELRIADGLALGKSLLDELTQVRVKERPSGRAQYGSFGRGQHDDLVLAVALACWRARRGAAGEMGERLV